MQWSPHINMLLQRIVYPDSPSAPFEQYYSTATGKRLGGDPNLPYLHTPCSQLSQPHVCRSCYILYILLIGLLDSNDELYQEWTVIVHQQGYFRIWSSSCKSVHNRSNISYTQVNTRTHTQPGIRGARRLAPLATPHTICIETHRSLRDYAFPGT